MREWLTKQDSVIPMVYLENIILTGVIDTHKEQDIVTVDIPNVFIQMPLPQVDGE